MASATSVTLTADQAGVTFFSDQGCTVALAGGTLPFPLGNSSGSLQGPTGSFYTGDYSYGVAAGDVNGDGANDLVTANYYGNSVGVLMALLGLGLIPWSLVSAFRRKTLFVRSLETTRNP